MIRPFVFALALAAMLAGDMTPVMAAGFDDWLKGVFDAPGRHAGRYYREKRVARPPKVVDPMKLIRNKMVNGGDVSDKQLQQLADSGDDLAAYNFARRIEETGEPDRLPTALTYHIRAVEGGRDFALRFVVQLLNAGVAAEDAELLGRAQALLEAKSTGNAFARGALVRMYRAGTPFGLDPARADVLIADAAKAGDTQAALDLAFVLLSGTPEPAEIDEAKGYLEIAMLSETLSIRTVAENLMRGIAPTVLPASMEVSQ